MVEAAFISKNGVFVPTELAGSPWGREVLHGGPPAGLLARAIEQSKPAPGMFVARLTVDLFRAVPMAPLEVTTRVVREGRRIQVVAASLLAAGVEVTRATALMLQPSQVQLPHRALLDGSPLRGPGGIETTSLSGLPIPEGFTGFHTTVEVRHVSGGAAGGPSTAWIRIPCDLVAGEEMSPLVRVAATSDFGNGLSHISAAEGMGFINTDITLYLHRQAVGEWICLEANSGAHTYGIGMIETVIHDERRPIGRAVQALLANRRSGPAGGSPPPG